MALELPVHEGLPADLNNFRTLVSQNRGYHFAFPYGDTASFGALLSTPLMEPYYTGLTTRVFAWIGETTVRFELDLFPGNGYNHDYYTSIRVEGTQVKVYHRPRGQNESQHGSKYTVKVPGYFTFALRMEFPSHILAIFGENNAIYPSDHPGLSNEDWNIQWSSSGLIKLLSLHVSDELGKGTSTAILNPERRHVAFGIAHLKGVFVVIDGHVVDISQDIVVSFSQDRGQHVHATFPPTDLQQGEEIIIFVRNVTDGWLVETSFSPDPQLVRGQSRRNRTYPVVSNNCEIHRMRWDHHVTYR